MLIKYTEATTSQSCDHRRADSRCCYGVCTNLLLAPQTSQRWPKWSLRSTRQTDPHLLAVSRLGREWSPCSDRRPTICHVRGGTPVGRVAGVFQQLLYLLIV